MSATVDNPSTLGSLINLLREEVVNDVSLRPEQLRTALTTRVRDTWPLASDARIEELTDLVTNELVGMGCLQQLLDDPHVTDVMVFGSGQVWIERAGSVQQVDATVSTSELMRMIERCLGPIGRRVDRASPIVDARLPDGSRLHAVIPPIAVDGPSLTIRRFPTAPIPLDAFRSEEDPGLVDTLAEAVRQHRSIVVSGATGAGKTTLLNALSSRFEPEERVITIEDSAELNLVHGHVVRLEARPANTEGSGLVTLAELVRTALRMRPDRIVVGEVRGAEVVDMLSAMSTGHRGSLSTVHANSARHALERLATLVLWSGFDIPLEAVRAQLAAAIDHVAFVRRSARGQRVVSEVIDVRDVVGAMKSWT